jgi:hypothetical protein
MTLIQAALITLSMCSNYGGQPIFTPITQQYSHCRVSKEVYKEVQADLIDSGFKFTSGRE